MSAARLPGGPVRMTDRSDFPLAMLHSQQIVSPAMLAELNAKTVKEKPQRTARAAHAPSHRSYAQVQDEPAEQRGSGFR